MGSQRCTSRPSARFLVHNRNDSLVRRSLQRKSQYLIAHLDLSSIALPWICVREVPVDIELVSFVVEDRIPPEFTHLQNVVSRLPRLPSCASNVVCNKAFSDVSVGLLSWNITRLESSRQSSAFLALCTSNFLYREGTHAKYHYMICGVQGNFLQKI